MWGLAVLARAEKLLAACLTEPGHKVQIFGVLLLRIIRILHDLSIPTSHNSMWFLSKAELYVQNVLRKYHVGT